MVRQQRSSSQYLDVADGEERLWVKRDSGGHAAVLSAGAGWEARRAAGLGVRRPATIPRARAAEKGPKGNSYHFNAMTAEPKTNCTHCGLSILVSTANRTGGYCMPHEALGWSFDKKVGGTILHRATIDSTSVPADVDKKLMNDWDRLVRLSRPGDLMIHFSTCPASADEPSYVESGYVIERNGVWIDGFVAREANNREYFRDTEEPINLETFQSYLPKVWLEWTSIYQEGDDLIHFRTSPHSWNSLCGREGYAIKRQGIYVVSIITVLN